MLLGAIPIVARSRVHGDGGGLDGLFAAAPALILDDWDAAPAGNRLLGFQVPTVSKKLVLAQYWLDLIESLRGKFRRRSKES